MATDEVPLLDQTLSISSTTFFPTNFFRTTGCDFVRILYQVLASGGTSPNFKADVQQRLYNADNTTTDVDYYNDGNHSASFSQNFGPGGLSNTILVPAVMGINLHANAADNTFTIRVIATGLIRKRSS